MRRLSLRLNCLLLGSISGLDCRWAFYGSGQFAQIRGRGFCLRRGLGLRLGWGNGCRFRRGFRLGLGLDYRLSWGIGVQRGYFDCNRGWGGLCVGRGLWQRLLLLRRRLEGWAFQFGVQGCALGFGIEDVCHHCQLRDSLLPRLMPACRWGWFLGCVCRQRGVPETVSPPANPCL